MGQTEAHLEFQAEKKKNNKGQSAVVILLAPPFCSTWCRMARGVCCSSDIKRLLLHVELASDLSVVLVWNGSSPLLFPYKDVPVINLQWAQSCQVNWPSGTDTQKPLKLSDFFKRVGRGISCTPFFFSYSTSGPLLPLPHPEFKSVNLLNYFKKCTACPLRHRKLHLMVYCIRISIFREKSTDIISDFLFPILLIFAASCIAWFGCCHVLAEADVIN